MNAMTRAGTKMTISAGTQMTETTVIATVTVTIMVGRKGT